MGARFSPSPYVSLCADYEVNGLQTIGTRDTSFVTHLPAPELRRFLDPRVQWSAFYRYNTLQQRGALNARVSWEFAPLSFLYVVSNDRQAILDGTTPLARSVIVTLCWLRQLSRLASGWRRPMPDSPIPTRVLPCRRWDPLLPLRRRPS